jgi:hypothetical protein
VRRHCIRGEVVPGGASWQGAGTCGVGVASGVRKRGVFRLFRSGLADVFHVFIAPAVRKFSALQGFDGVDDAGVVFVKVDAAAIRVFQQGAAVAVVGGGGPFLAKLQRVFAEELGDPANLALCHADIAGHPAAIAAAQAFELFFRQYVSIHAQTL